MSIKPWDPGTGPSGPTPGSGGWRGWWVLGRRIGGPPRAGRRGWGGRPWRGPGPAEPGRAEPGRAEPGRAEPGRAEPGRAEPAKPGPSPAAVLFDLDGLLVDSEPLWTIAESELAEQHGRVFTPEIKGKMIGKRLEEAVPILLAELGHPDADQALVSATAAQLLARMVTLFGERLTLQPGAEILLDALHAAGVPVALVSSSYRSLVDAALAEIGPDRFTVTVAGDEVTRGKPDPEPYLTAARRLGVDAGRCVVLEDTEAGGRSATAAGCRCVIVPTLPVADGPWRIVASLLDVTVPGLASLVEPEALT